MDIIISNSSNKPIYEQIASRIRDAILSGELAPGQALPSIRALANDLKVSVITTKRAYADLEAAGFIDSVQGKGSFVTGGSLELQREEALRTLESRLAAIVDEGASLGLEAKDLHEMIDLLAADAR
ncbi:MAG: GntR family transcriptional regulator [Schaalia hyovaginalis]|uniref:GntR family transcriptional regulator n=1 Tax=Schaalia TaxID=2529408 RepID=UPI0012B3D8B5|nr:GntR family transcriptional regulator [Schaalia hyovaginalis]MCI6411557.1 GntR family transcriptional regulator [Schaalia hyovaginalis]MCI6557542.1 GntR family transcriptional regulator [Schaalia hyovaginalis]MCI7512915.1 GntR family transcriptional regulator [Schaalia hyovaginalis]MDD7553936.1 GntR family transcriptional regulator [Schaalia hyovaginalis]MDY3093108.1 GntR family transcriptional regulator [Schaalia hyovaginalis]